jgi:putative sterol carrier protein
MTDPSREFFDEINRLGHDRLLEKAAGTLRIDLTEGSVIENWFITIDKGNISATREGMPSADAVLRADRATFEQVASGQVNATAAIARGQVSVRGDSRLLIQFLRLFPARPGTPGRRLVATGGRRQR